MGPCYDTPRGRQLSFLLTLSSFDHPTCVGRISQIMCQCLPNRKLGNQPSQTPLHLEAGRWLRLCQSHAPWKDCTLEASDPQSQGTIWAPLWQRRRRATQPSERVQAQPMPGDEAGLFPRGGWGISTCWLLTALRQHLTQASHSATLKVSRLLMGSLSKGESS